MYVHGSEERLVQADKIDGLEAASVLKISKKEKVRRSKKEKVRRLGGESSTWSVFEAD